MRMREKTIKPKKAAAAVMAVFCISILLNSCGSADQSAGKEEMTMTSSTGMGRYMETAANFADRLTNVIAIGTEEDGKVYIFDTEKGIYEIDGEGPHVGLETAAMGESLKSINKEGVITNAAISPKGEVAVVYMKGEADAEAQELGHALIDAGGNKTDLELPDDLSAGGISQLWYRNDGTLYGTAYDGKVYEVGSGQEDCRLLFDFGANPGHISFMNHTMILINANGIFFYDLDNKEWLKDEVAEKFISEECSWEVIPDNQYSILSFSGTDDSFYIACDKGLYRHTFGGASMELVIDGALCSLGDLSQRMMGMVMAEDNEFAALHYGGKSGYYVFHPDIPTLPEKVLKVYSLKENDLLNQTIHAYQAQNPDVLVKKQIGIQEGSNVTREDAVKILNTGIMSGDGPDLLILDELPAQEYISKGILKDISGVVNTAEQKEEFFANITGMYREGDKTYGVPTLYRMLYISGDREIIDEVQDMKSLADAMEKLREENPEGNLLGLINEEQIIRTLAMACAPAWEDEEGKVDREKIEEFLIQTKRIYDAQTAGISDEEVNLFLELTESETRKYNEPPVYTSTEYQTAAFGCGYTKMMIGYVDWCLGYSYLPSIQKNLADRDIVYKAFTGQSSNIYLPYSAMGINAASANGEMAEEFLQLALSRKVQDAVERGFPVNRGSLEARINKEIGIYFAAMPWFFSPVNYTLLVEWAEEEDFKALEEAIVNADTPYMAGGILEDVVLEIGTKVLNDEISIEAAADEIVSRAGIYMTE